MVSEDQNMFKTMVEKIVDAVEDNISNDSNQAISLTEDHKIKVYGQWVLDRDDLEKFITRYLPLIAKQSEAEVINAIHTIVKLQLNNFIKLFEEQILPTGYYYIQLNRLLDQDRFKDFTDGSYWLRPSATRKSSLVLVCNGCAIENPFVIDISPNKSFKVDLEHNLGILQNLAEAGENFKRKTKITPIMQYPGLLNVTAKEFKEKIADIQQHGLDEKQIYEILVDIYKDNKSVRVIQIAGGHKDQINVFKQIEASGALAPDANWQWLAFALPVATPDKKYTNHAVAVIYSKESETIFYKDSLGQINYQAYGAFSTKVLPPLKEKLKVSQIIVDESQDILDLQYDEWSCGVRVIKFIEDTISNKKSALDLKNRLEKYYSRWLKNQQDNPFSGINIYELAARYLNTYCLPVGSYDEKFHWVGFNSTIVLTLQSRHSSYYWYTPKFPSAIKLDNIDFTEGLTVEASSRRCLYVLGKEVTIKVIELVQHKLAGSKQEKSEPQGFDSLAKSIKELANRYENNTCKIQHIKTTKISTTIVIDDIKSNDFYNFMFKLQHIDLLISQLSLLNGELTTIHLNKEISTYSGKIARVKVLLESFMEYAEKLDKEYYKTLINIQTPTDKLSIKQIFHLSVADNLEKNYIRIIQEFGLELDYGDAIVELFNGQTLSEAYENIEKFAIKAEPANKMIITIPLRNKLLDDFIAAIKKRTSKLPDPKKNVDQMEDVKEGKLEGEPIVIEKPISDFKLPNEIVLSKIVSYLNIHHRILVVPHLFYLPQKPNHYRHEKWKKIDGKLGIRSQPKYKDRYHTSYFVSNKEPDLTVKLEREKVEKGLETFINKIFGDKEKSLTDCFEVYFKAEISATYYFCKDVLIKAILAEIKIAEIKHFCMTEVERAKLAQKIFVELKVPTAPKNNVQMNHRIWIDSNRRVMPTLLFNKLNSATEETIYGLTAEQMKLLEENLDRFIFRTNDKEKSLKEDNVPQLPAGSTPFFLLPRFNEAEDQSEEVGKNENFHK